MGNRRRKLPYLSTLSLLHMTYCMEGWEHGEMMCNKRGQQRKKERPEIKWYPNTEHQNIPSKTQRRAQQQPHNPLKSQAVPQLPPGHKENIEKERKKRISLSISSQRHTDRQLDNATTMALSNKNPSSKQINRMYGPHNKKTSKELAH
jgi:hypothetical protein